MPANTPPGSTAAIREALEKADAFLGVVGRELASVTLGSGTRCLLASAEAQKEIRAALASLSPEAAPETWKCATCGKNSADGDWYRQCGPCHWGETPEAAPDAPRVSWNTEDAKWLVEIRHGDSFTDIDVYADGDVIVKQGGKDRPARSFVVRDGEREAAPVPAAMPQIEVGDVLTFCTTGMAVEARRHVVKMNEGNWVVDKPMVDTVNGRERVSIPRAPLGRRVMELLRAIRDLFPFDGTLAFVGTAALVGAIGLGALALLVDLGHKKATASKNAMGTPAAASQPIEGQERPEPPGHVSAAHPAPTLARWSTSGLGSTKNFELLNGELLVLRGPLGIAVVALAQADPQQGRRCRATYEWRYQRGDVAKEERGSGEVFEQYANNPDKTNHVVNVGGRLNIVAGPYSIQWSCGAGLGWIYPRPSELEAYKMSGLSLDAFRF